MKSVEKFRNRDALRSPGARKFHRCLDRAFLFTNKNVCPRSLHPLTPGSSVYSFLLFSFGRSSSLPRSGSSSSHPFTDSSRIASSASKLDHTRISVVCPLVGWRRRRRRWWWRRVFFFLRVEAEAVSVVGVDRERGRGRGQDRETRQNDVPSAVVLFPSVAPFPPYRPFLSFSRTLLPCTVANIGVASPHYERPRPTVEI